MLRGVLLMVVVGGRLCAVEFLDGLALLLVLLLLLLLQAGGLIVHFLPQRSQFTQQSAVCMTDRD